MDVFRVHCNIKCSLNPQKRKLSPLNTCRTHEKHFVVILFTYKVNSRSRYAHPRDPEVTSRSLKSGMNKYSSSEVISMQRVKDTAEKKIVRKTSDAKVTIFRDRFCANCLLEHSKSRQVKASFVCMTRPTP